MKKNVFRILLATIIIIGLLPITAIATNVTPTRWDITANNNDGITKITFAFNTTDTAAGTWHLYLWNKDDTSGTNGRPAILNEATLSSHNGDNEMELNVSNGIVGPHYVVGLALMGSKWSTETTETFEGKSFWPIIENGCHWFSSEDESQEYKLSGSVYINGKQSSLSLKEALINPLQEPVHTHEKGTHHEEKDATCTEEGNIEYWKCSGCDKLLDQDGNEISDPIIPIKGHSFTNYVSDNNATCTADGTKTAKCDRCDETDTQPDTDSALGHSFANYASDNNATCTADGTKTAKCERCDKTDTQPDEGSALGHQYGTEGESRYTCERCGEIDQKRKEEAEASDPGNTGSEDDVHTHEKGTHHEAREATCIEDGCVEYWECSGCDQLLNQNGNEISDPIIPKKGHSFTNYVSNNDATCTEDGTKTAKCERCDKTDTQPDEGSALGHQYGTEGESRYTCERCGEIDQKRKEEAEAADADKEKKDPTISVANKKKSFTVPAVKVAAQSFSIEPGTDSTGKITCKKVSGSSNLTVSSSGEVTVKKGTTEGTYKIKVRVTVAAKDDYNKGSKEFTIQVKVVKESPELTITTSSKTYTVTDVDKKEKTFDIGVKSTGNGKITCEKTSGTSKITVNKDGKLTVQKGITAGTYEVNVKVSTESTAAYESATRTFTITVRIKKVTPTIIVKCIEKTVSHKKDQSFDIGPDSTSKGKISCECTSLDPENQKIKVEKNGKITIKKGLKKGIYKIKIKITVAAKGNYAKATKTVTVKVKIN